MFTLIFNILLISFVGSLSSTEATLFHIKQLTNPAMGFEKAGEAYFSPDGKKIIFQAVPTGEENYQIFILDLNSNEITRVSQGFGSCTCGYFRPDGKKIIFAGSPLKAKVASHKYHWDFTPHMNIYEANLDGSDLIALTEGPAYHAECSYSSDGSHIVYASNEDGSMNIFVMKSDGSDVQQLTHTKNCYNGGPFFSPDNSSIVFRADRDKSDLLQLYFMDSKGKNLLQLTNNGFVNWAPFWHPSGKAIAYTTSIHGHHQYQIYLLFIETGKALRITHSPSFNGLPAFNREGTKLLWTSKRGSDNTSQIFIADFHLEDL